MIDGEYMSLAKWMEVSGLDSEKEARALLRGSGALVRTGSVTYVHRSIAGEHVRAKFESQMKAAQRRRQQQPKSAQGQRLPGIRYFVARSTMEKYNYLSDSDKQSVHVLGALEKSQPKVSPETVPQKYDDSVWEVYNLLQGRFTSVLDSEQPKKK